MKLHSMHAKQMECVCRLTTDKVNEECPKIKLAIRFSIRYSVVPFESHASSSRPEKGLWGQTEELQAHRAVEFDRIRVWSIDG
jgi:hypothetical protein